MNAQTTMKTIMHAALAAVLCVGAAQAGDRGEHSEMVCKTLQHQAELAVKTGLRLMVVSQMHEAMVAGRLLDFESAPGFADGMSEVSKVVKMEGMLSCSLGNRSERRVPASVPRELRDPAVPGEARSLQPARVGRRRADGELRAGKLIRKAARRDTDEGGVPGGHEPGQRGT